MVVGERQNRLLKHWQEVVPLMSFSSRNDSTALLFSGGRYPLKYPFILMIILMFRFSAWGVQILWLMICCFSLLVY
uniref:Uncharacterized protein n=1 Tax=Escherichia coli TaxID=562 RepID=A0A220QHX9_ECOLX|nr:hypothetical protein [Escherichia coli]